MTSPLSSHKMRLSQQFSDCDSLIFIVLSAAGRHIKEAQDTIWIPVGHGGIRQRRKVHHPPRQYGAAVGQPVNGRQNPHRRHCCPRNIAPYARDKGNEMPGGHIIEPLGNIFRRMRL